MDYETQLRLLLKYYEDPTTPEDMKKELSDGINVLITIINEKRLEKDKTI